MAQSVREIFAEIAHLLDPRKESHIPKFGIADIDFHAEQFNEHLGRCVGIMRRLMYEPGVMLMLKHTDPESEKIRWTSDIEAFHKPCVNEWVSAIRDQVASGTPRDKLRTRPSNTRVPVYVTSHDRPTLSEVESRLGAYGKHMTALCEAIEYLLCDFDSPVSWDRETNGSRWWSDALRIIRESDAAIRKNISSFISFARPYAHN